MTESTVDPLTKVVEAAKTLAVQEEGVDESSIEVRTAERVTWSDGSLGCPVEGMIYTQAVVEGYWVVLASSGRIFDYRSELSGPLRLCIDGQPPASVYGQS